MKTLTSPVTTQAAAAQSGWAELYDFYLNSAISTPWGTISTLRLTSLPGGMAFFTPKLDPEPSGTQGAAATYNHWPIKRQIVRANSKFANDKLAIAASNVTAEFAQMLADVEWDDVPVVVRKVPTSITGATADDCAVLFIGQVDSAKVTLEQLQFVVSSDLGTFQRVLPAENMHATCRFRWADDQCTAIRYLTENYKTKTVGTGSTTTRIKSTGLTEDAATAGHLGAAVEANPTLDEIGLFLHGLANGDLVKFGGTTMPGGITAGRWYYVVEKTASFFKVSLTEGGATIDLTSAGSGVTVDSTSPYGTDLVAALADGSITASSQQSGYEGYRVKEGAAAADHWRFSDVPSNPAASDAFSAPHLIFDLGAATSVGRWIIDQDLTDPDWRVARTYEVFWTASLTAPVTWTQAGYLQTGDIYYNNGSELTHAAQSARYWRLVVRRQHNGKFLNVVIGKVKAYDSGGGGSDLINPLADSAITASNEKTGYEGYRVQSGASGSWKLDAPAPDEYDLLDWGNNYQGYWQIPDAQAGIANAALKPYLQFDFGSAKAIKVWRLRSLTSVERDDIPRLLVFFSSSDAATWTHEGYFEIPPTPPGKLWDALNPKASSKRYWRICVRATWAEALTYKMLCKVRAHENARHWWRGGLLKFDAATATVALRNLTRPVLESANGELTLAPLPVAPASGDTFVVERGCNRTFNDCAERRNTENFGGFNSLPFETVLRQ